MSTIKINNLSQVYKNEYSTWRETKDLNSAKRQEYLRRNPDEIEDYDLQRAKILLFAVEMMDKSLKGNSNKIGVAFETATNLGLGYAAIGGAALGFLITKLNFVKKAISKIVQKHPVSRNIFSMGISVTGGILGILAAYPAYNFLSNIESKIHRKRKFETMEKELQDPKIFVVLDSEQKKIFVENLPDLTQKTEEKLINKGLKKEFESIKQVTKEALYYDKEQTKFKEKYREDKSLYENKLTEQEIKSAQKDRVLLSILIREINTKSQSYKEKMQRITDNLITLSFALGSIFALAYERVAKKMNLKTSSLPASMGVLLLVTSTFFGNWAQRRASHVGRFKAIQEMKQNPERLVYINKIKTDMIEDDEVQLDEKQRINIFKFMKKFFKHNREYQEWKNTKSYTGNDISNAMKNVEISPEQLQDGKRLQKNLFKTYYKVDKNTQNYSNDINVMSESVKYPITLILGSIGSVWGIKYLTNLRNSIKPAEVFKNSAKYLGIISLFTIPTMLVNAYFAKAQKMGARISDMMTMKDLEDYRFFADYSRFESGEVIKGQSD